MANMQYKLFQYDSETSDTSDFEELMSKIYTDENMELVSMRESISPTGKYTAVIHYTVETPEEAVEEARVSEGAEL